MKVFILTRDPADIPEFIEVIFRLWVEVEPEEEQVRGEEANGKDYHKA
jgi:hypothetical protein